MSECKGCGTTEVTLYECNDCGEDFCLSCLDEETGLCESCTDEDEEG